MKNLIFDLDGTLWDTLPSYYYAFDKFYEVHPLKEYRVNKNIIKEFRALTMDEIAPRLFPLDPYDIALKNTLECLKYTCEYLKDKEVVNENVIYSIKELSNKYSLYIVSNCPIEYINIFFEKTNLKDYFKDVIALGGISQTIGFDKANNISTIVSKYSLDKSNTFFIGDSEYDLLASQTAGVNFIFLNTKKDIKKTVEEKITNQEILNLCDFYKEYLYEDASVVLMVNNNQKEYKHLFGFLTLSKTLEHNVCVFNKMERDAYNMGFINLVGPVNYSSWFDYRLPIDNFDKTLIPDILGCKEDIDTLKFLGYKKVYTYASTMSKINTRLEALSKKAKLPTNTKDTLICGKEVFDYAPIIFDASKEAFKDGYLYSDVPYYVFNDIYMGWLKKIPFDIDLYMINDSITNKLIAYGICYFDKINNTYVCKTAAVLSKHQKTCVVMCLVKVVFERARYYNAPSILYHFQNEQKNTLSAFWRGYEIYKKRYALFKKEL